MRRLCFVRRWDSARALPLLPLFDIFPTLCELCDLPIPDGLDCTSMARLLRGEEDPDWPDVAFGENWQPSLGEEYVPAVMMKKGPYKLSRFASAAAPARSCKRSR